MGMSLAMDMAPGSGGGGPRELVSNGTFDVDATGWTAGNATHEVVAGKLIVTSTGTLAAYSQQTITGLTAGRTYSITGTARRMDANSTSARVSVYDTPPATNLLVTAAFSSGAENTATQTFVATDTTVSVTAIIVGSTGAGAQGEFDNISLQAI